MLNMSRILAIDYGKKRTGVAVTDILQIIANGLTTVPTHQLMDFILKYVESEPVERIIVGHPKQMNNQESENMRNIVPFINQLKKNFPIYLSNWLMNGSLLFWRIRPCWMADSRKKIDRIKPWLMKSVLPLFYNPIWNQRNI